MKQILFLGSLFLSSILVFGQTIVINEFMSSNETTIPDSDGDYSDWIELYNKGDEAVNMNGLMITDDTLQPDKWIFPEMIFQPQSFLLIFASEKDRIDTAELHTNFKIQASGEYLLLSDSNGEEIDRIEPVQLTIDFTYGRFPDGENNLTFLGEPTPNKPNMPGTVVTFSMPPGFYQYPFEITLSSSNPGDTIFYTLDGSVPDTTSFIFSDSIPINYLDTLPNYFSTIPTSPPILVDWFRRWYLPANPVPKANVIRAVAYNNGLFTSQIMTATYFVDTAIYTKYYYPIVSITTDSLCLFDFETGIYIPGIHWDSLNTDNTGNYYQQGDAWERPVHIEYFEENGNRVISQDAGIRIQGKITRHAPQKTLCVYARSEYGTNFFNYPLMLNSGADKFKRFLLRTSYADNGRTLFRDEMTHDLVIDLNLDLMYYRPVIVFINGEYWGIQAVRDQIDKYALGFKYDIDPDSIDILKNNAVVEEGSNADYLDMIDYIQNHDISEQEHYNYIKTRMDIDNYIDYEIVEIYINNDDWPGTNIAFWREQAPGAKWRWILFDLDNGFNNYAFNTLEFVTFEGDTCWQTPTWATFLFRNLLKNEEFKSQFVERFAELLNTTFRKDTVLQKIAEFTELYEHGIDLHVNRWTFPWGHYSWLNDIENSLGTYATERPCYMRDFILDFFELEEDEFNFHCEVGTLDIPRKNSMILPNPTSSKFKLILEELSGKNYQVAIFNNLGSLVRHYQINPSNSSVNMSFDVSGLRSGIYLIQVIDGLKIYTEKLIVTAH
jgi:hypothetical protein